MVRCWSIDDITHKHKPKIGFICHGLRHVIELGASVQVTTCPASFLPTHLSDLSTKRLLCMIIEFQQTRIDQDDGAQYAEHYMSTKQEENQLCYGSLDNCSILL